MVVFKNKQYNTKKQKISIGEKAIDFKLIDINLEEKTLNDFVGKTKVFSIVPSIDTSVCDYQTRYLNEKYDQDDSVVIITISMDLPFAFKNYCATNNLKTAVCLSDHKTADFAMNYGVLIEELRLMQRAVIVINKLDEVIYTEYIENTPDAVNFEQLIKIIENN